jgi:hypothetical protein
MYVLFENVCTTTIQRILVMSHRHLSILQCFKLELLPAAALG